MTGTPEGSVKTLIAIPTELKDEVIKLTEQHGTTLRLETIAALRMWCDQPNPAYRADARKAITERSAPRGRPTTGGTRD